MNYPKALYQGSKQNRSMSVAYDEYQEQELRNRGLVDFADLADDVVIGADNSAELAEMKKELDKAHEFSNDIVAMQHRISELSQTLPHNEDYASWTVAQLKNALTLRGIGFNARANKAELLELMAMPVPEPEPPVVE